MKELLLPKKKLSISSAIGYFFGFAVVLTVLFLIVTQIVLPNEGIDYRAKCKTFDSDWFQILENKERIPVELPGKLASKKGEWTSIVKTIPNDISEEDVICFTTSWQNANIYIDGELRLQYDTKNTRLYAIDSPQRRLFISVLNQDIGKEIQIDFQSHTKYSGQVRSIYIGPEMSIWMELLSETIWLLAFGFLLMLIAIFNIIIVTIFHKINGTRLDNINLAWVVLLVSVWMLSEQPIRQLFISNLSSFVNVTYWCLMLLPIPILLYFNDLQKGRYFKLYLPILILTCIAFVIINIFQIFEIAQYTDMLYFIHGLILFCVTVDITTMLIDIVKKQMDYWSVAIGASFMLFMAVLEIGLYYIGFQGNLGYPVLIGLSILWIAGVVKSAKDLSKDNERIQKGLLAKKLQGKFLANMSHEIRTPINAVIGLNEMILREDNVDVIKEYAKNAQSASKMLLGLVNDVLDFSKIESGQIDIIEDAYDLAELIRVEAVILNARIGDKPIVTKFSIDPKLPQKLYGDEIHIKQIVTNLLTNAAKYTKEGGIELEVSYQMVDDNHILLSFVITDTGIGIQKDDMDKLFESFKRLEHTKNRNIEGTGLGLNITKQLTNLMNGNVTVSSIYGQGSSFAVSIPQRVIDFTPIGDPMAKLDTKEGKPQEEKSFTAPGAKVLAVDDNSMNLMVLKGLLKRTKMQVDTASSGKECLELTKKTKYNVILLDHMMPEMDGIETLKHLREDKENPNASTPAIVLTAHAVAGCREEYLSYGFDEYVSKPIVATRLEETLQAVLSKQSVTLQKLEENLLLVDEPLGLSYVLEDKELFSQVLSAFCEQIEEYLPQLEKCYQEKDYKTYAMLSHSIKGNAKNIGAIPFSELAKKHEFAGREENKEFISTEFSLFLDALKKIVLVVKKIKQKYDEI